MTGTTIQAYENAYLRHNLLNAVTPKVDQCWEVLEELLDRVNRTWWGFSQTSIEGLWRPVWWSRWYGDELALLRRKLRESRESLRVFLMGLNSYVLFDSYVIPALRCHVRDVWRELGNQLCCGRISIDMFYMSIRQRLPSLSHIQLESVSVTDHLGRNLPVPTMFCSTWKVTSHYLLFTTASHIFANQDFNYIIMGYCKGYIGGGYVERGEYNMITAEGHTKIGPTEFAREVNPGMILEMSIVLRQRTTYNRETCPRCHHINLSLATHNGWIEWQVILRFYTCTC